jgi:hypothetical protein
MPRAGRASARLTSHRVKAAKLLTHARDVRLGTGRAAAQDAPLPRLRSPDAVAQDAPPPRLRSPATAHRPRSSFRSLPAPLLGWKIQSERKRSLASLYDSQFIYGFMHRPSECSPAPSFVLNDEHEFTSGQTAFVYVGSGSPVHWWPNRSPGGRRWTQGREREKSNIY